MRPSRQTRAEQISEIQEQRQLLMLQLQQQQQQQQQQQPQPQPPSKRQPPSRPNQR